MTTRLIPKTDLKVRKHEKNLFDTIWVLRRDRKVKNRRRYIIVTKASAHTHFRDEISSGQSSSTTLYSGSVDDIQPLL